MTTQPATEAMTGQVVPGEHAKVTAQHARDVLAPRGLTAADAQRFGVYSITTVEELPESFEWAGEAAVPALVIPWIKPSGDTVLQLRPDRPIVVEGEERKYLWPKGCGSVIGVVREDPDSGLVIFAEGTMQARAVAANLPAGSVYALAGCRNWSSDGAPLDLSFTERKDAVAIFDGDLSCNPDVWAAAEKFGRALNLDGARSVRFAVLPISGKAGVDDVLGQRPPGKRAAFLGRLIDSATEKLPPRPKAKKVTREITASSDRPVLEVNGDRHEVINQMVGALKRWDGNRLFSYGGLLAELRPPAAVKPLDRDRLHRIVAESATCVTVNAKGEAAHTWPDGQTTGAVMASSEDFTVLERISRAPFVRPDGSICQTSGYDTTTRTFVALDASLEGLTVPEEPTREDVASALKLLTEEWLGDFMPSLPEPADRANLLGLMLTPLIRGLVELAPLAVVDGLQAGVGKNLVADLLSILGSGRAAQPLPYTRDDDETRKVITSAFRSGAELFVFDEAHTIEGGNFARAITSVTYQDRVLGVSTMAEFPNRITWVSLGNQVTVNGDMSRRVFRIRLAPTAANPADRPESDFRHPDIRAWTAENRAELLRAVLVLVRSWFADGQPAPARPVSFGSFERWAKVVGGILAHAGIDGFLGNLVEWRSETDFERAHWGAHFGWLAESFGIGEAFTAADAARKLCVGRDVETPPGMDDPTSKGYARALGMAYAKRKDRVIDGLILRRSETWGHGKAARWYLEATGGQDDRPAPPAEGVEGVEGPPFPTRVEKTVSDSGTGHGAHVRGEGGGDAPSTPSTPSTRRRYPVYPDYPSDEGDPLVTLLPLLPPVPPRVCPDCDAEEALTPSGLWYACTRCHPASFAVRA